MSTHNANLANGSLVSTRLASGHVLLDWNQFAPSGLVLYHLNENTGTSVADSSGNGNTASLSAANWNAAPWLGASALGASATLTPGTVPALGTGDWTQEFWVYVTENAADNHRDTLTTYTGPSSQAMNLTFRHVSKSARWEIYLRDNAGHSIIFDWFADATVLGTWAHVALVRDGNTLRYYLNGVQKASWDITGYTFSAWTGRTWVSPDAHVAGLDELRDSASAIYPNGTTFYPVRYPASGTWTEDAADAQTNSVPGVLTVTLAAPLPTGTSLKCKLLSATGGDTGWQTMTGSGTSYSYDFTGAAAGDWRAAVELYSGGTLSANTPDIAAVAFEYGAGGNLYTGDLAASAIADFQGQGYGRFVGDMACDTIADFSYLYWPKPTPSSDKTYWRRRSQFQADARRVSRGRSLAWLEGPPATGITLGLFHALEADFETVAAAGFNTVLSAAWPNVLGQTVASVVAASDAAGLLAGVILPDTPETSQIAAYGSHDAVRAWYAQDEPNTQTDWEDRLAALQGYKDEWDTEKPIMVCCNYASADEYRDRFRAFLAESEIVCHNNYPYRYNLWPRAYTFETPTGLMTNMPIAQDIAEREDREHWVILQAHGQNSTTTGLAMPSAKFLRAQAYASLIQGATGLIWFCMDNAYIRSASLYGVAPSVPQDYGEGGLVISEAQAYWASYAWAAIAAIVADVSRLEDVWLAPTSALDYVITFDEESFTWSKDPICAILKEYEGDYYLFIANIENYPHGVQVILPIEPSVETLLGPTASIEGGTLSVELGAWGVWGGKLTT